MTDPKPDQKLNLSEAGSENATLLSDCLKRSHKPASSDSSSSLTGRIVFDLAGIAVDAYLVKCSEALKDLSWNA